MLYKSFYKNSTGDTVICVIDADNKKDLKDKVTKRTNEIKKMKRGFVLLKTEPSIPFILKMDKESW